MTFDYRTQYQEYRVYIKKLMKETQTPAAKTSLAIVGTIMLVAFLSLVAIRPTLVIVASLTRSISDEERVLAALETKIQSLQAAQRKLDAVKDRMALANAAIPTKVDLENFIKEIEILAVESNLKLLNIDQSGIYLNFGSQPKLLGVGSLVEKVDLNLSIGGDEAAIRSFLGKIIKLDRLVLINDTEISDVSENIDDQHPYKVQARVSISIFTTQKVSVDKSESGKSAGPAKEEL